MNGRGAALWLALGAFATGCGRNAEAEYQRYVPNRATATQAVTAALDAWKDSALDPPRVGQIRVQVADTQRRPADRLESFDVLGEVPGEGPRTVLARLRLHADPEPRPARFVVVGIDPIWVFRAEDYEMLAHWDCDMNERSAKAKAEKGR